MEDQGKEGKRGLVKKTYMRRIYGKPCPVTILLPFKCPFCGNPQLIAAKDCRKCHSKREPCRECGGPVGRTMKPLEGLNICNKCRQNL